MKLKKRKNNNQIALRERKRLREHMRIQKVLEGINASMSVNDIHHATGLSEKNIRKILKSGPEEITFALLKRDYKWKKAETF